MNIIINIINHINPFNPYVPSFISVMKEKIKRENEQLMEQCIKMYTLEEKDNIPHVHTLDEIAVMFKASYTQVKYRQSQISATYTRDKLLKDICSWVNNIKV